MGRDRAGQDCLPVQISSSKRGRFTTDLYFLLLLYLDQIFEVFLTYLSIQDRDIPMFTYRWQNRSHKAAYVEQAVLYSRQAVLYSRQVGLYSRQPVLHLDVPNNRITFATLACATVIQNFKHLYRLCEVWICVFLVRTKGTL